MRELFQFDCADLDFGIYRILNKKRGAVNEFIQDKLPEAVAQELNQGALRDQSLVDEQLEEVVQKIRENLGANALDGDGNLDPQWHKAPLGKEYLKLKEQAVAGLRPAALESNIYNHLYEFFNRYYKDGDFISQRRYSRRRRYAIPYNGEEVHLHWANHDQYYIKTGEHFHDYSFTSRDVSVFFKQKQAGAGDVSVRFKLQSADVEQDNVKGDKRFFLPQPEQIAWEEQPGRLTIPFEYRPLTGNEAEKYGKKPKQDTINSSSLSEILDQLSANARALDALKSAKSGAADGDSLGSLAYHLKQYTRRNTSDFFIHKNLKDFLTQELDFFLKNEVLMLDEMENIGEERASGWFQTMRAIRAVGGQLIDFLSQVEDFQKMLWEKRKFVMETHYCITIGNIDKEFYPAIAACDAQWDEWKKLFHIDEPRTKKDKVALLQDRPTLVLDTGHFDSDFTDELLASFDDLDETTDGLLVHSENWQALNLLLARYREKVKCIYIDPPYNTAASEIVYKNNYKHSSWITLLSNRIKLSKSLLPHNGASIALIDHEELLNLGYIKDYHFGKENRLGIITVYINPKGRQHEKFFSSSTEYMFVYAKNIADAVFSNVVIDPERQAQFDLEDENGKYRLDPFVRVRSSTKRDVKPQFWYPIYVSPDLNKISAVPVPGYQEVYPTQGGVDYSWKVVKETFEKKLNKSIYVAQQEGGKVVIYNKFYEKQVLKNIWTDKKYFPEFNGTQLLKKLFGKEVFSYPKSVYAVSDILKITGTEGETALDYFAGSGTTGHAVINLNREDAGRRRFILVEMGEYFDTVLLPRLKKVTYAPEWKNGNPERTATQEEAERSPRIIKYQRLESYEDALNNITFDDSDEQKALGFEDYLLKYMLEWEAKRSETLLNVEHLARPFRYKLQVHRDGETRDRLADIPETFNYLLGLQVRTRQVHHDKERRYLVYRGTADGQEVAVIWRDAEGWKEADLKRDKAFVIEQKLADGADLVFVNGDSFIPNAKALEPLFKQRMFAPADA